MEISFDGFEHGIDSRRFAGRRETNRFYKKTMIGVDLAYQMRRNTVEKVFLVAFLERRTMSLSCSSVPVGWTWDKINGRRGWDSNVHRQNAAPYPSAFIATVSEPAGWAWDNLSNRQNAAPCPRT
ncbi:hypothetical protein AVEN_193310-1 [Araneus ventricosus]|uniref:Uncharacterized protein n=1 Tax=Araneus ventricosus TaxID=182803 RepID=A0A4Y2WHM1_ARAVE|nr:hypothetical protein AVEN_193310-1 [Araneus ventricosus]